MILGLATKNNKQKILKIYISCVNKEKVIIRNPILFDASCYP
jgi:hypothetical protein